jgi:hypothetical protein
VPDLSTAVDGGKDLGDISCNLKIVLAHTLQDVILEMYVEESAERVGAHAAKQPTPTELVQQYMLNALKKMNIGGGGTTT